jgi:hypothetical protein
LHEEVAVIPVQEELEVIPSLELTANRGTNTVGAEPAQDVSFAPCLCSQIMSEAAGVGGDVTIRTADQQPNGGIDQGIADPLFVKMEPREVIEDLLNVFNEDKPKLLEFSLIPNGGDRDEDATLGAIRAQKAAWLASETSASIFQGRPKILEVGGRLSKKIGQILPSKFEKVRSDEP